MMKITKRDYIEYLVRTPVNYTCSNLAKRLEDVSHDAVSNYLQRETLTARHIWELAEPLIADSTDAYLIVDDSVQAKPHARKIEWERKASHPRDWGGEFGS